MTIKELKDTIGQYPDDAQIVARVIARNGRGGAFEEQLILNDSHHEEEDNTVYLNCGFEIGWLNAHPEFQPPAEPEAKTYDEARREIFEDLGVALGREVKPEQTLSGLTLDEIRTVLGACDHLVGNGSRSPDSTASRTPGTRERLLSLWTFGNLVDYMLGYCGCEPETRVLVTCSCGNAPELRTGVHGKYAYVCPNCGRAGAITDTQEQAAVLWNQAFGETK